MHFSTVLGFKAMWQGWYNTFLSGQIRIVCLVQWINDSGNINKNILMTAFISQKRSSLFVPIKKYGCLRHRYIVSTSEMFYCENFWVESQSHIDSYWKTMIAGRGLIMYKIGKHEGYDIIPLLETDILFTYPIIKHTVLIFPLGYRFHQHFLLF